MQLTVDFISESFERFNTLYFEGKLRRPNFEITSTKSFLGQFSSRNGIYKIRISNRYEKTEREYQNTILHEMIHEYIRQNKIKDTRTHHGKVFFAEAARINKFGWEISRCDSACLGKELSDKTKKETYNICCYYNERGQYFLFCLNPNKVEYYKRWFKKYPSFFQKYFFFVSDSSKDYATLPQCRKGCRGRYIDEEKFESLAKEYNVNIITQK